VVEDPQDPSGDWERHYYADEQIRALHEKRLSGLRALARRITEACPERGKLLDVGAGLGLFMQEMAALGWVVEGVEPSRIAAQAARERTGAIVHQGVLEALNLPEASYDAVAFFDALRTVPDPALFLRQSRRLLSPAGTLFIREVHRRAEMVREHMKRLRGQPISSGSAACEFRQCFTPKSLRYAFERAGLIDVQVEPSPVYAEPDGVNSLSFSLVKRSFGWVSGATYLLSGHCLVPGPNLLAFGSAPKI
jgi:SAM-dependent methyltransferase